MSLKTHFESWLERKVPEVSNTTLDFYKGVWKKLEGYFGDKVLADINDFTQQDLIDYRNELSKKLAGNTVNQQIKALRSLFKEALKGGYLLENPLEYIEQVKVSKDDNQSRRPFTLKELKLVLGHANDEWRGMILFGLYTGQRLGDIARLQWSNVDLNRKEIRLVTGKTGKRVHIPMAEPLYEHVSKLPRNIQSSGHLHPHSFEKLGNASGRVATLSNQFAKILEEAGLRDRTTHESQGKGRAVKRKSVQLSFHCLVSGP